MEALFVLVPAGRSLDEVVARHPELAAGRASWTVRAHPAADDGAHLLSLVRASRDRVATRWLRGMVACVLGGAALGAATAGILAAAFAMFGGLLGTAVLFGGLVGAFLGGFTGAMTGTQVARDEVRQLGQRVQRGDALVSIATADTAALARLQDGFDALGFLCCRRGEP